MEFLQKSFAKGILSNKAFSRVNIPGKAESARDLFNYDIGRSGEIYRRGGTALLESLDYPVERVIPFESHGRSYLIIFLRADVDVELGRFTDREVNATEVYPFIRVLEMTNYKKTVRALDDVIPANFQNSLPVQIYKKGNNAIDNIFDSYYRDPENRILENELASMTYCQIGDLIVFVNETFPPFAIRKEGNNFIYYRNLMDMLLNGDGEFSILDALSVFPYSYYGFGLEVKNIDTGHIGTNYFEGEIVKSLNYDKTAFSRKNINFWLNRLFINSVSKANESGVIVYGGIIREISLTDNNVTVFGEYQRRVLNRDDITVRNEESEQNMYLCDWSPIVGWPRCIAEYENRFCYAGNDAYPAKFWFSSQPSLQRVPFGSRIRIEKEKTEGEGNEQITIPETRIESPIFKTVYYDQLDLFNKDERALGLVLQHTASAGNYFINDSKGLDIYWIVKGEVLFIGTNKGVFISSGTDAGAPSPIPFNTGFRQIDYIPVKRSFPIVEGKTLYFVTQDESLRMIRFGSERGYEARNIDSFSREIVRDNSSLSLITKYFQVQRLQKQFSSSSTVLQNFSGEDTLNLSLVDPNTNSNLIYHQEQVHPEESPFTITGIQNFFFQKPKTSLNNASIDRLTIETAPHYNDIFPLVYDYIGIVDRARNFGNSEMKKVLKSFIDRTADDNKLKNYSVNTFLYRINVKTTATYKRFTGSTGQNANGRLTDLSGSIIASFLARKDDDELGFADFDLDIGSLDFQAVSPNQCVDILGQSTTITAPLANQFIDRYDELGFFNFEILTLNPLRSRVRRSRNNTIKSYLKGDIDNGYIWPERVDFHKKSTEDNYSNVENNRLAGVDVMKKANGNIEKLRLYLSENSIHSDIKKIEILQKKDTDSNAVSIIKTDDIPGIFGPVDSVKNEFGVTAGVNVYNCDVTLTSEVTAGDDVTAFINSEIIIRFLGSDDNIINSIVFNFEASSEKMRDSLLNNYSGEFYTVDIEFRDCFDRVLALTGSDGGSPGNELLIYTPSGRWTSKPAGGLIASSYMNLRNSEANQKNAYKAYIDALNAAGTLDIEMGKYKIGVSAKLSPTGEARPAFRVTANLPQRQNKEYPAFASDTRLIYDWLRSALMVFRKGSYLSYFNDKEGAIDGWTRGDINLEDVCYLGNLKHQLPERHPMIVGKRGNNVYIQTAGVHDKRFPYLQGLPNCLDEHIAISVGGTLNLTDLKSKVKALGYTDNEKIVIADDDAVIQDVNVGDLSGRLNLKGKTSIIIGKPFTSNIISSPIQAMSKRRGEHLITKKHRISILVIYVLVGTIDKKRGPDFFINLQPTGEPLPVDPSNEIGSASVPDIDAYEYTVHTELGYNPKFSLVINSPFPFAITGYFVRHGD